VSASDAKRAAASASIEVESWPCAANDVTSQLVTTVSFAGMFMMGSNVAMAMNHGDE
jgi:hypothetical protein